ncbi:MAG: hypothetical protein DCC67_04180 [Planctomycetota bacterium]|nr:MAG: hypothetical protein DCC67_04180 [Planctomycetota bacterium]
MKPSHTWLARAHADDRPINPWHADLAGKPLASWAANCGLNGTAWVNAFDLAASGGVQGIRLHALLSVWRN